MIAVLAANGQSPIYIPGRTALHDARTYRGAGKTNVKDAGIITDPAKTRCDLAPIHGLDEITVELRMLAEQRADIVSDRTRAINRLQPTLLEYFPGLEAAFGHATRGAAVLLLTEYQTPEKLRRAAVSRVTALFRKAGTRNPSESSKQRSMTPLTPSAPASSAGTPPRPSSNSS